MRLFFHSLEGRWHYEHGIVGKSELLVVKIEISHFKMNQR